MNALLLDTGLRPSYSWLLDSRGKINTAQFINAAGGEALDELRLLPAYQAALLRQQHDTEAGLARIMIRTGKSIRQITGDDLLFYADVVKTSGRQRREHLMWELLVQLALWPLRHQRCERRGQRRAIRASTAPPHWSTATASLPPASGICSSTTWRRFDTGWITARWKASPTGSRDCFGGKCCRSIPIKLTYACLRRSPPPGANSWRRQPMAENAGDPLDPVCDPRLLPGLGRMVSRRSGALGGVGSPVPCAPDAEPCRCQKQASAAKRYAKPHPRAHTVITDLCRRSKSPKAPHCRAFGTRTGMRRWPSVRGRRFGLPA
ncbi:hypothetical protein MAUB1S_05209 [Mycolicibacterium aubagnense]